MIDHDLPEAELTAIEREGYRFGQEQARIMSEWAAYVDMMSGRSIQGFAAAVAGFARGGAAALLGKGEQAAAALVDQIIAGIDVMSGPETAEKARTLIMERLRRRSESSPSNPPPHSTPPS